MGELRPGREPASAPLSDLEALAAQLLDQTAAEAAELEEQNRQKATRKKQKLEGVRSRLEGAVNNKTEEGKFKIQERLLRIRIAEADPSLPADAQYGQALNALNGIREAQTSIAKIEAMLAPRAKTAGYGTVEEYLQNTPAAAAMLQGYQSTRQKILDLQSQVQSAVQNIMSERGGRAQARIKNLETGEPEPGKKLAVKESYESEAASLEEEALDKVWNTMSARSGGSDEAAFGTLTRIAYELDKPINGLGDAQQALQRYYRMTSEAERIVNSDPDAVFKKFDEIIRTVPFLRRTISPSTPPEGVKDEIRKIKEGLQRDIAFFSVLETSWRDCYKKMEEVLGAEFPGKEDKNKAIIVLKDILPKGTEAIKMHDDDHGVMLKTDLDEDKIVGLVGGDKEKAQFLIQKLTKLLVEATYLTRRTFNGYSTNQDNTKVFLNLDGVMEVLGALDDPKMDAREGVFKNKHGDQPGQFVRDVYYHYDSSGTDFSQRTRVTKLNEEHDQGRQMTAAKELEFLNRVHATERVLYDGLSPGKKMALRLGSAADYTALLGLSSTRSEVRTPVFDSISIEEEGGSKIGAVYATDHPETIKDMQLLNNKVLQQIENVQRVMMGNDAPANRPVSIRRRAVVAVDQARREVGAARTGETTARQELISAQQKIEFLQTQLERERAQRTEVEQKLSSVQSELGPAKEKAGRVASLEGQNKKLVGENSKADVRMTTETKRNNIVAGEVKELRKKLVQIQQQAEQLAPQMGKGVFGGQKVKPPEPEIVQSVAQALKKLADEARKKEEESTEAINILLEQQRLDLARIQE